MAGSAVGLVPCREQSEGAGRPDAEAVAVAHALRDRSRAQEMLLLDVGDLDLPNKRPW